ncbi:hypothetical protein [Haloferula rosea]|uniref:Uncharacterized protein n=1 Tax=Haloferula rosea TaxID=490093 RepID=A0A934RDL3_9BACT|nr:hypothetical protein [Haloferula rosea]MBK1827126.1 hypothetical protein [Haloferula rosea]
MSGFRPWVLGGCLMLGIAVGDEPRKAIPLLDLEALDPTEQGTAEVWTEVEAEQAVEFPRDQRVRSESGQFGVNGGQGAQRASIAIQADDIRRRFNALLDQPDAPVSVPIEILLHGKPGDPPRARPVAHELRYTADTYLLRIHVDFSRGLDRERMEGAIIRGLLFQRALHGKEPGSVQTALKAPVWLVQGITEADAWRQGRGDRKLYEGVFQQGGRFTLDQLFAVGEEEFWRSDGVSRAMFRAQSGAMVMALIEQPQGKEAFAGFCDEVAVFEGEMPILLRTHFPEMNLSEKSLAKWWALTMARLAEAPITEVMNVLETERALADALVLHFRDEEGVNVNVTLEEWQGPDPEEASARYAAVRPAQDALNRLSYRCFPSYRSLLSDYQLILMEWARDGRNDKMMMDLVELNELRARMLERATRGRDYLDYMEIAGATELSGSFDDYMRLKQELKEKPRVVKDDPVSKYLDTLEAVYERNRSRK